MEAESDCVSLRVGFFGDFVFCICLYEHPEVDRIIQHLFHSQFFRFSFVWVPGTLPETNISRENGPLEKEIPIGKTIIFRVVLQFHIFLSENYLLKLNDSCFEAK